MESIGKFIMRLGFGGMMLKHGIDKVMILFSGGASEFPDPLGLGPSLTLILVILAEGIGSILIILGVKIRLVSIPLIFNMFVAAFIYHHGDPWPKKEMSVLYFLAFVVIALIGAGKYSLGAKFNKES